MERATKPCAYCREEIHSRARRCPHCHAIQGPWLAVAIVLFALFVSLGVYTAIELTVSSTHRPTTPTDLADQVEVIKSELVFGKRSDNLTVGAIGMLKNNTDIGVHVSFIEVRYYSPAGELVDVHSDSYPGIAIPPHGDAAFKVSDLADQPKESYASHKVFVRNVRSSRR